MILRDPSQVPPPPRLAGWPASLAERRSIGIVGVVLIAAGLVFVYGPGPSASTRDLMLGAVLLPGIACAMIWLRFVMRFRVLIATGETTGGTVEESGEYEFRDHRGREFRGKAKPPIEAGRVAVLFDSKNPRHNRIVRDTDFATP